MSHIRGTGYGASHDWRGDTPQDNSKRTFYVCQDCGANFVHCYDDQPDIFAAMRAASVGECPDPTAERLAEGNAA